MRISISSVNPPLFYPWDYTLLRALVDVLPPKYGVFSSSLICFPYISVIFLVFGGGIYFPIFSSPRLSLFFPSSSLGLFLVLFFLKSVDLWSSNDNVRSLFLLSSVSTFSLLNYTLWSGRKALCLFTCLMLYFFESYNLLSYLVYGAFNALFCCYYALFPWSSSTEISCRFTRKGLYFNP